MNLCDINTIKSVMSRHGFSFSKALGQNFLIDEDVCPAIARSLNSDSETGVLEIGPGIGVLTKELSRVAGKVVTVELDDRLIPVLEETLGEYDNIKVVHGDAMKIDLNELIKNEFSNMKSVKVAANLPYYITSPIIMTLLESKLPIEEIVVMVQKEAATRLAAEVGTRDSGAVTATVSYYAESSVLFDVMRDSFMPSPKVDSAVIDLKIRNTPPVNVNDEKAFFKLIKAAFSQRRKTFVNSVSSMLSIPKENVTAVLEELEIESTVRGEKLTLEDFANISDRLF